LNYKLKQLNARVISNAEFLSYPGATYFLLRINAPEIAATSKPGQFCMLKCGADSLLRRPLSIHAATPSGEIAFLYDDKGKGKSWLARMAVGAELDIIGPLGNGFDIEEKADNILLAAGGIGIAPLSFLAERAVGLGKHVTLLAGARCSKGLYPGNLLPPGITIIEVVESREDNNDLPLGKLTDFLPGYIDNADQIFACGPQGMLEAISNQVDNKAIAKPVQVSLEVRMGCGLGTCYGCSIKTRRGMQRVCKEGPVFNIKDIIWQEVTI
jgi:dihydroorotate dehydrogenase electron transfer subunit